MNSSPKDFMHYVQLHERAWGEKRYLGRPDLSQILKSKVVVFWRQSREERLTISLHNDLKEIEQYFIKSLMRLEVALPDRLVMLIFVDHKRVKISGVKVKFKFEDAPET